MHAQVMTHFRDTNGSMPEGSRFLVYKARNGDWTFPFEIPRRSGGVADRFTGIVSLFALSVISNRVFLIDWPGVADALASPHLDLFADSKSVMLSAEKSGRTLRLFNFPFQKWGRMLQDLREVLPTDDFIFARTGHGYIGHMFKEKQPWGQSLLDIGITFENAFGCFFDYLFTPTKALRHMFSSEINALKKTTNPISIMIQIRTGDRTIMEGDHNDELYTQFSHYFECAKQLEETLQTSAVWYLMTDSNVLRQHAISDYGDKIITHSSKIEYFTEYTHKGLMDVIGEQWVGGLCDYFIISIDSGLGRQSAFRSKHPKDHIYDGYCNLKSHWDIAMSHSEI